MSWRKLLRPRQRPSDLPSDREAGQEIDDELMFHLRSLVDDDLAKGASFDTAWRNAQSRFGSLRRYSDACRRLTLGERRLLQRFSAVGLVVLGLLVGWLTIEVRSLRREQVALIEANTRQEAPSEAAAPRRNDVTGRILDRLDQPIAGARVLVIVKTWPAGRYRQDDFATTSDAQGRFRLSSLVPSDGQYAVQVAALKDGYALTSSYRLTPQGSHATVDPVTLKLDEASQITLMVQDCRGRTVANAGVVPASRRSLDGRTHLVYFQASEPIQTASDAEGRVSLACFGRGEQAEIYLRLPGKDWELHAISIPKDGDIVVVSAVENVDTVDPSSPDKNS